MADQVSPDIHTDITADVKDILTSLEIDPDREVTHLERIFGGADARVWKVVWRSQPYALRVFRPERRAAVKRETEAILAAAAGGIPVPKLFRQAIWRDHPVLLISWIPGSTLSGHLFAHPQQAWKQGTAFGRMQAAIHRIPAPPTLKQDSTGWIEWAGDEPALKTRLYELPSRATALLHLDYHPLNVMTDHTPITGVLDWTNAAAGDPRADFARTCTILRIEPLPPAEQSVMLPIFRRVLEWAWRSGYRQAGGHLGPPDEMALFYGWAGSVMLGELENRVSNPDHWMQRHHLDAVYRWRDGWKRRAGLPVSSA